MEGIQTIQALKAVQSSLPAQTTIPSDELVMLYATDGTPIAKISRDDLVKAVASVMASNSQNTFSKLLGVQANGTPMGIGASDLASVLGDLDGLEIASTSDLDDFKEPGTYWWREYPQNSGGTDTWCFLIVRHLSGTRFVIQEIYRISGDVCLRTRVYDSGTWGAWVADPDSYLYNCPTPAALASLLGVKLGDANSYFADLNIQTSRAIITGMWNIETAHAPIVEYGNYGVFFYIPSGFSTGNFGIQVAASIDTSTGAVSKLFTRGLWSTSWGAWKEITLT